MSDLSFDLDDVQEIVEFPVAERVDNCVLMGAKLDEKKNIVIGFRYDGDEFKGKKGAVLSHREFNPTSNPSTDPDQVKKSWDASRSRIHHILGRIMPLEEAREKVKQGDGSGWERLSGNVVNLINSMGKGKSCSLKVVYNKKNYPSFPNYPDFMSTTDFPKTFSTNPMYDKYEKREIESSDPSSLASSSASTSNEDIEDAF